MKTRWLVSLFLVGGLLLPISALANQNPSMNAQATAAATAPPASKMRWDIISVTASNGKTTLSAGGIASAAANDGSYITLKGNGTFGPGVSDPVTGGGDWATFDAGNRPTGSGKYKVTAFAGFDWGAGQTNPAFVDAIGNLSDVSGGVVTLRIAYSNADGSDAGAGTFIISCHQPAGASDSIVEGVIASKGATLFYNPAHIVGGVDQGRTQFHFIH